MVLWDFCAQRRALIHNLAPRNLFQTGKQSLYQYQFGVRGNISNLCSFDWYDWCYYREEGKNLFPMQKELLGRVLGPAKNEGNEMAQNVLSFTGHVLPRRSVRKLTLVEMEKESEKAKRLDFDVKIKSLLGDSNFLNLKILVTSTSILGTMMKMNLLVGLMMIPLMLMGHPSLKIQLVISSLMPRSFFLKGRSWSLQK